MKIIHFIISILLIIPWNLQVKAFNWSSVYTTYNIKQQPSLDELANQAIDQYKKTGSYISPYAKNKAAIKIRNEQCEQAYIDTLLESIIHHQKKPQFHGNHQAIIEKAKKNANQAHQRSFVEKPQWASFIAQQALKKAAIKKQQEQDKIREKIVKQEIEKAYQAYNYTKRPIYQILPQLPWYAQHLFHEEMQ